MAITIRDDEDKRLATEAVLPALALYEILNHSPRERDGYTCDEMGCMICNAGLECIPEIVRQLPDRFSAWEAADALEELANYLREQLTDA